MYFCESVGESNYYLNGSLVEEGGDSDISVLSTTPKLIIFLSLFPIGYRSKQTQTLCQWERAQTKQTALVLLKAILSIPCTLFIAYSGVVWYFVDHHFFESANHYVMAPST